MLKRQGTNLDEILGSIKDMHHKKKEKESKRKRKRRR